LDEGEVIGGKLVVTRRRPTTLLDPIEESLDPVAGAVEIRAEADRITAIAFWRDVGPCALLHGKLSDQIGVVATTASSIDPNFRRDRSLPASQLSWVSPGLSASLNHRHPTKLNAPDPASAPLSGKSGDQQADNPR
jgi:hypothetical protein